LGDFLIYNEDVPDLEDNSGTIGIQLGTKDDYIVVLGVKKESPAEKAGVKNGHRILSIDGKSTYKMPLKDAALSLRGKPGTLVVLRLKQGLLPWGRKVPLIRISANPEPTDSQTRDGVYVKTVPLVSIDKKVCPAVFESCHLIISGDNCVYTCAQQKR